MGSTSSRQTAAALIVTTARIEEGMLWVTMDREYRYGAARNARGQRAPERVERLASVRLGLPLAGSLERCGVAWAVLFDGAAEMVHAGPLCCRWLARWPDDPVGRAMYAVLVYSVAMELGLEVEANGE